jgi:hypothetical protein
VILTKSHRGFTLKYSISLTGAISTALAVFGCGDGCKCSTCTRDEASLAPSYKNYNRIHSEADIRLCGNASGLREPRRSAWGYQGFIWGDPVLYYGLLRVSVNTGHDTGILDAF